MSSLEIAIRYIGKKRMKRDTTKAKSQTVWLGNGDVQRVSPEVARELLKHPDIWEAVSERSKVVQQARGERIAKQQIQIDTDDYDDAIIGDDEYHQPLNGNIDGTEEEPDVEIKDENSFEDVEEDNENKKDLFDTSNTRPVRVKSKAKIVEILKNMPKESMSATGKPRIDEVRRLTNNPAITTKQVRELWDVAQGVK